MRWLLPALLFLASCGSTPATLDAVDRAQLRRPEGTWPEAWAVRGTYLDGAGRGAFEDRYAGDQFTRVHRSSLPGGSGSIDGQAFLVPIDGLPRPASGRAAREAEVTAAVLSGRWVTAERIELRALGEHRFELGLEGQRVAELTLDPATARPTRLEFPREVGGRRFSFRRWEAPHGFPVAHEVVLENAQGRVAVWRAREVWIEPADLERPPVPNDVTFASAVTQVVARRTDTRLVAEVLCDGHPAGWWLVDSGAASSAIAPELADALSWPPVGEATLVGAAGRANRGIRRSGEVSVGGLTVTGLPLVEADEAYLSEQLGVRVRGVLGADVLARCVVELDFAAGRMWVLDPSEWRPPAKATPVTLDGSIPLIEASFAPGHQGVLRVDTGSDDTLTFHGPTVRRLGLAREREDLETVRIRGVGGDVLGDRGRHEWVTIGAQRFGPLPVTYLRHSTGALSRRDVDGNLGAGFFHARRLVLALPLRVLVVE